MSDREVAECLVVAGSDANLTISSVVECLGVSFADYVDAVRERHDVALETGTDYSTSCLWAAYRIIESDETLRQEWFGE